MSICKQVEWDGNKFSGYIDYGTGMDSDELPEAKEVLVFMLNCINGNWKIPVGYFFIDGLTSIERSNLIQSCLELVDESGVEVVSLTFDGASVNLATAKLLGCNFDVANLKPSFPHPVTKKEVFVLCDPSHMIKLVRNTLGSKGSLFHPVDGFINWKYIDNLEKLQRAENLLLGTKLRRAHVEWYREKMKVRLVTQTLSNSVADALDYCEKNLKLGDFQGSGATAKFCRIFNNLFDILNSKNLLGKDFRRLLSQGTVEEFFSFMEETELYIEELKTGPNGPLILDSNRKTEFIGLIICMHSVSSLYKYLTMGPNASMKFLMTYKVSQDHLEMFFSAIRSKGGFNNNPTCKQFQAAYIRLLWHVEVVSGGNENCIALDNSSILNVSSTVNVFTKQINKVTEVEEEEEEKDESCKEIMLNPYTYDVTAYIAGFVCRKLIKSVECSECISVLTNPSRNTSTTEDYPIDLSTNSRKFECRLTARKDRGGLTYPSKDVMKICQVAEKEVRFLAN